MPILEDGSCAPSFVNIGSSYDRSGQTSDYMNSNHQLHVGYVAAIHYPKDKGYESSKIVLYDIVAPVTMVGGGTTWMTFRNARWGAGTFGSIADFTRARLCVPKGWQSGAPFTQEMVDQSSRVVFLCENGRSQSAVIVGLAEHSSLFDDSKEWGHYSASSFNGVRTLIDKEGQYSVTFTGAILDPEANAYIEAPEATTGTTILMDKEGSILLDNVKGESIKLDKTAKSIVTTARSVKTDVTDKDHATTAKGKITFLAQGNAVFNGKKVYIGDETNAAKNPLVLGNQLATFVQQLLSHLMTTEPMGQLGAMPVIMSPALKAKLSQLIKYGTQGAANPFLSKKGYVE
jgi:hypothetical protein